MSEWFSQYWYLVIIFFIVLIAAIVILNFAAKAYSKHAKTFKEQEAEMKRLLALKERYYSFTRETLIESDEKEILEGVALSYQLRLQKEENPEKAFGELNEEKQLIYVLDVFCGDGDVKVFYSQNGDIVRNKLGKALDKIGMADFAIKVNRISQMYDETNEDVSYSEKEIDKVNAYIEENDIIEKVRLRAANFIKENCDLILN